MKLSKFTNILVIGLTLTLAASGCRKRPYGMTPMPGRTERFPGGENPRGIPIEPPPMPITTPRVDNPQGTPMPDADKLKNYIEHPEILEQDTVHFAFDSSAVRDSEKSKVAAVADYLKGHAGDGVRIQGHCDERGTAEYNRALGERRALALRDELVKLGVDAGLVDTISFGFERPVDPGHDAAAWAKNRRGVFIVLTPPGK